MDESLINLQEIKTIPELVSKAKWLECKTLREVGEAIASSDTMSRITTKGNVGHFIEKDFFGIEKNSNSQADIAHLGVEIKTNPLKYTYKRTRLAVKEPLSLNIINYEEEVKTKSIKDSSLYKKNKHILFILYIHDKTQNRSDYLIKYVFLWEMDDQVLNELRPDYNLIVGKIKEGKAHEIHQGQHRYLTLCPKHGGDISNLEDKKSRRKQPFSDQPAEIRAFRLKNSYMNMIIARAIGNKLEKRGGWIA